MDRAQVEAVDTIYAYMYGRPCMVSYNRKKDCYEYRKDKILEISTKDFDWSHNNDRFYYIWGFPGPDFNVYRLCDFGITWGFKKEDIKDISVEEYLRWSRNYN